MDFSTARGAQRRTIASVSRQSGLTPITVKAVEKGEGSISSMFSFLDAVNADIDWKDKTGSKLGVELAAQRNSKGLSQRQMAKLVGVTQPTIIALEVREIGRMSTLFRYMDVLGIRASVQAKRPKSKPKLVPAKNSSDADKVFTPRALASTVIQHLPISGVALDPCRGDGAFFDQLPDDIERRWCEVDQGRDFLDWNDKVDWVISNPPWSKMREFLNHGMTVADNVCYLAAFTHFTTKARVRDIANHGFAMRSILFVPTPKEWPQSGFQMTAVWLQRGWDGPCEMRHLT